MYPPTIIAMLFSNREKRRGDLGHARESSIQISKFSGNSFIMTFLQTSMPRKSLIAAYLLPGNGGVPPFPIWPNATCPPSYGLSKAREAPYA
jgi:hypothetical protein